MTKTPIKNIGWVVSHNGQTVFGGWAFDAPYEPFGYTPEGHITVYGYTLEELKEISIRHKEWGIPISFMPSGLLDSIDFDQDR